MRHIVKLHSQAANAARSKHFHRTLSWSCADENEGEVELLRLIGKQKVEGSLLCEMYLIDAMDNEEITREKSL